MQHAKILRAIIEKYNSDILANPSRLQISIENGGIEMRFGSLSFINKYVATITFNERNMENGNIDRALVPIIFFIYKYYPEKILNLGDNEKLIDYAAQIIDDETANLTIALNLEERVKVVPTDQSFEISYMPTPQIDDDKFDEINSLLKDLVPHPFD